MQNNVKVTGFDCSEVSKVAEKTVQSTAQHGGYCCAPKQYVMHNCIFTSVFEVVPRAIIIKKKNFRLNNRYEKNLRITNIGLYSREIDFGTDRDDTTIQIPNRHRFHFLEPNETFDIQVVVVPTVKKNKNQRRHIYLYVTHPNVVIEIPIIVLDDADDINPSIPEKIIFQPSAPNSITCYEFLLYNPSKSPIVTKITTPFKGIRIMVAEKMTPPYDYIKVLLVLCVTNLMPVQESLHVRFGKIKDVEIKFVHNPVSIDPHLSVSHLNFPELRYMQEDDQTFLICNDSEFPITVSMQFLSEDDLPPKTSSDLITDSEDDIKSQQYLDFADDDSNSSNGSGSTEYEFSAMASKHFYIMQKSEIEIKENGSQKATVLFKPNKDVTMSDKEESPYYLLTKLIFTFKYEDYTATKFIIISGMIRGPAIFISPRAIDFGKIYIGEEHCTEINVENLDDLMEAEVMYKGANNREAIFISSNPESGRILLPILGTSSFNFSLHTRVVGKFLVRLTFRVRNGLSQFVLIKGNSQTLALKSHPAILDFGSLPICVPKVLFLLLVNPCSVPLTAQLFVKEDGEEMPLVLNILDIEEPLPVTVKDPVKLLLKARKDEEYIPDISDIDSFLFNPVEEDAETKASSLYSFHSVESHSDYSVQFQYEIIEPIPEFAQEIVQTIKQKKILEGDEVEKNLMDVILRKFLETNYFHEMDLYKNYAFMDWSSLPSDPKEIYVSKQILQLNPNIGKKVAVLLVPNKAGIFYRNISCRVCPEYKFRNCKLIGENKSSFVSTESMTSKIEVIYNCVVPKITWTKEISFTETIYIGEDYFFEMPFTNVGEVGGFIFYDVVPDCKEGVMSFVDGIWKFFVEPSTVSIAHCQVQFREVNYVKLHGLVKTIGCPCSIVFTVSADVHPTKLIGLPTVININIHICQRARYYIYFENASPIGHSLRYSLEKETENIFLYPYGARLNPDNQRTYLTIFAFYKDPGRYFNTLHIDMQYLQRLSIPIYFTVTGMPIFTDPNFDDGYHMGNLTKISECQFQLGGPKHEQKILFKNCGTRSYNVTISLLRSGNGGCAALTQFARLDMNPKQLSLNPGDRKFVTVSGWSAEEKFVQSDFLMRMVDISKPKRFENKIFTVTANFINPKISWQPYRLILEHLRTHIHKEHSIEEITTLINQTDAVLESVYLQCLGPLKMKELYEDPFVSFMNVSLKPAERKEITLLLDKSSLQDIHCQKIESRICATTNEMPLKSLLVRVIVKTPIIEILPSSLVLFVNERVSQTVIELKNIGCMDAQYKWKKISEELLYVDSVDDEKGFIQEILSEIFQMLDISESTITEEIENENLSERYRRYRCKLRRLEDEIGIKLIIDEIIDNLDLEHKRYLVRFNEEDDLLTVNELLNDLFDNIVNDVVEEALGECLCEEEEVPLSSGKTIPPATLNEIIRKLKLEDSYEISDPSSSYCSAERFVYFYQKMGIVYHKESSYSLVHLPGIRKGYELRAKFELSVIGGESDFFELILVNLRNTVELSRHHIYIGALPWYEMFLEKVIATNLTQYMVNIKIEPIVTEVKGKLRFLEGYLHLVTHKYFEIKPCDRKLIQMNGAVGFAHEFRRELKLIINGGEEMRIVIRGQGVMPILSEISGLKHIEQTDFEIYEDYIILQKVYYYEIFRAYRQTAEDIVPPYMEEEEDTFMDEVSLAKIEKKDSDFDMLNDILDTKATKTDIKNQPTQKSKDVEKSKQQQKSIAAETSDYDGDSSETSNFGEEIDYSELRRMKKLLDTYVVVKHTDVPNRIILQQVTETEKFKRRLREGRDTLELLTMVHKEHWKFEKTHDFTLPLNLKHFTIQPLPFQMNGYQLDMGTIKIGQIQKYEFSLQFLGPGQLIAQARMPIDVPGLFVSLYAEKMPDNVVVKTYRPDLKPDSLAKPYRNMWERIMDAEKDPKLLHAHSFDIDFNLIYLHKRNTNENLTALDRMNILEYYSSLCKTVYLEQKHHPILCKLYPEGETLYSGPVMHVIVLFKPEAKYFANEQFFDDYLYIDIHMGPIIPIAMKGQFKKK